MRIIAGTKRGMKLVSPETRVTRPITDRVKESLFNVLQNYDLLAGARVADLFCGVGSLGLEALSRGAAFVTFVERECRGARGSGEEYCEGGVWLAVAHRSRQCLSCRCPGRSRRAAVRLGVCRSPVRHHPGSRRVLVFGGFAASPSESGGCAWRDCRAAPTGVWPCLKTTDRSTRLTGGSGGRCRSCCCRRKRMSSKQAAIEIICRLQQHGFQALLAGGCVRDMLLGRPAKDYDVATDALPADVVRLFRRTLQVGAKFGVVIVLIAGRAGGSGDVSLRGRVRGWPSSDGGSVHQCGRGREPARFHDQRHVLRPAPRAGHRLRGGAGRSGATHHPDDRRRRRSDSARITCGCSGPFDSRRSLALPLSRRLTRPLNKTPARSCGSVASVSRSS